MSHAEKTLTVEDFLRLPETEPASEYIDGEVIQKVTPKARHSCLQLEIGGHIHAVAKPHRLGIGFPELRCTFAGRSLVFDLAYFQWDRIVFDHNGEPEDDVFLAPSWVIEILSPGQTIRNMTGRISWCVEHGVRLAWLVIPSRDEVHVFRPGDAPQTCEGSDRLDAGDVLPGFSLRAEEIFAWLRPGAA